MVETLLNLLWLVVTLATLWLWRFRWLTAHRHPRTRVFQEVVAVSCALALLFPVISLTDDLHPEIVAVDASSGKRNSCLLDAGAARTPHVTPNSGGRFNLAVFTPRFERVELSVLGIVAPLEDSNYRSWLWSNCSSRSPPFVS